MAATGDAPPSSAGQNRPDPGVSQAMQPSIADHQVTKFDAVKESSPTSVFVNSEPIREDQVENAVKFLSHPKVRGSPVIYRRSFLEKKGLTKEEIDEAFRRIPDPSPPVATTQPVVTNSDEQIKASSNAQQQPPAQNLRSTSGIPASSVPKKGRFTQFHWSHVLFAFGFFTASGAGTAVLFKNAIIPRLKLWIRKVVLEEEKEEGMLKKNDKRSIEEEATAAAKAAAIAAADVARASQEMLIATNEEKRFFEELISTLNVQVREMKSMSNSIKKLEEGQSISRRIIVDEQDYQRVSLTSSRLPYTNGKANIDSHSVRSLSPPAYVEPSVDVQSKSYGEIMDMIQNGENPFNIRDVNDASSNPDQPVLNPRSEPRPKPWEFSRSQNSSTNVLDTQETGNISSYRLPDKQLNGDDPVPWWQRQNPRITEIESDNDQKFGPSNRLGTERPVQHSWIPPQPPPVAMLEAAAAIRQPKKQPYQKEEMTDDQSLARAPDVTDELQRITKISESGGFVDTDGEYSQVSSTEIQKEDNGSYL
ncbi:peroxisomal membrane protein PEX14-like [Primulina huaijiensis]|uniref:peroxisomal membrane protein PEX14-like n=1 Tax=Primulina huaijiensis TaxID=1492673 RepID=UPI003CC7292C